MGVDDGMGGCWVSTPRGSVKLAQNGEATNQGIGYTVRVAAMVRIEGILSGKILQSLGEDLISKLVKNYSDNVDAIFDGDSNRIEKLHHSKRRLIQILKSRIKDKDLAQDFDSTIKDLENLLNIVKPEKCVDA